jgi:hypothetical protein
LDQQRRNHSSCAIHTANAFCLSTNTPFLLNHFDHDRVLLNARSTPTEVQHDQLQTAYLSPLYAIASQEFLESRSTTYEMTSVSTWTSLRTERGCKNFLRNYNAKTFLIERGRIGESK